MRRTLCTLGCFALVLLAAECFAQSMYTITDLGTLNPAAINRSGQIVGSDANGKAFIWSETGGTNYLGLLPGGTFSNAVAINDNGIVTGTADGDAVLSMGTQTNEVNCTGLTQLFVWSQQKGMKGSGLIWSPAWNVYLLGGQQPPICPPASNSYFASDINVTGAVAGSTGNTGNLYDWALVWDPEAPESLGFSLASGSGFYPSAATGINSSGQFVGFVGGVSALNPFGPLAASWGAHPGGPLLDPNCSTSVANDVNDWEQIVGWSACRASSSSYAAQQAVVWNPDGTKLDVGTIASDPTSLLLKLNSFGDAIGASGSGSGWDQNFEGSSGHPVLWSEIGGMLNLNSLIASDSNWTLSSAADINASGQIIGEGMLDGQSHAYLLTPIYSAVVQSPIFGDGSSIFSSERSVIPVVFSLNQNNSATCALPAATISLSRIAGTPNGVMDPATYTTPDDNGSNFTIDPSACLYKYQVSTSTLTVGTYRVDLAIAGVPVGHAIWGFSSPTPSVISWPMATPITYGQPLSSSTLTGGSASVPGNFYWAAPGSFPGAGMPVESVTFTPIDLADFAPVTGDVQLPVTPAVLTVTASNATINYGQPVPALDFGISGFVITDTTTVVSGVPQETTTGTATSQPGSYPITITQGTLTAANYTFTFVNGTLTIAQAPQSITFNHIPAQTVGTPVVLSASASSGLAVSFNSLTTSVCTVTGTTANMMAAGTCSIEASQAGNGNYLTASPVTQSFRVNASATFTITPNPPSEIVQRGQLAAFLLTLRSVNGFSGLVKLTCSGGPVGSKCMDFPKSVYLKGTAYAASGILFPLNTAPGKYTMTFTGVSGSITRTTTANFTVK